MHASVNVTHEKRECVCGERVGGMLASLCLTPVHPFPLVTPSMSLLLNMCAAVSCRLFVWMYGVCARIQYTCLDKEHFYIFQLGILSGERAAGDIFTAFILDKDQLKRLQSVHLVRNLLLRGTSVDETVQTRSNNYSITTDWSGQLVVLCVAFLCSHRCRFPFWALQLCFRCSPSSKIRLRSSLFISLVTSLMTAAANHRRELWPQSVGTRFPRPLSFFFSLFLLKHPIKHEKKIQISL